MKAPLRCLRLNIHDAWYRMPDDMDPQPDTVRSYLVKSIAVCGPLDLDDPQPAITVMMPDGD
jgi:hypothetical protein